MMREQDTALLVHDRAEHMWKLASMLRDLDIRVHHAPSCQAAKRELARAHPPSLVFTDADLPDGKWSELVWMAERAVQPVNVIVVARLMDEKLYIEVLEAGAFDFIAAPFAAFDLAHVFRCAANNIRERRGMALRERRVSTPPLFDPPPSSPPTSAREAR